MIHKINLGSVYLNKIKYGLLENQDKPFSQLLLGGSALLEYRYHSSLLQQTPLETYRRPDEYKMYDPYHSKLQKLARRTLFEAVNFIVQVLDHSRLHHPLIYLNFTSGQVSLQQPIVNFVLSEIMKHQHD